VTGPRHRAREAALQALYLWEIGRTEPEQALDAFFSEHAGELDEEARAFVARLVRGTTAEVEALDRLIERRSANWRLARLAVIDRLILRMAVWELRHERGTPHAVVIDEALELARTFSGDDAVRFVNGVLDGIREMLEQEGPEPE
jgi:N utilization substance protein B